MPRPQRVNAPAATRTRATRTYAKTLRQQVNAPVAAVVPASSGGHWAPVTGQIQREQEAWLGRTAGGTRLLVLLSFVVPMAAGVLTTSAGFEDVVSGVFAGLLLLVLLMSLGGGGPLGFMGRAVGNSVYVGTSLAGRASQGRRGAPGRVLIVSTPAGPLRLAVARPIDLPIGTTVTVRGPRFGGYLHAWTIKAEGLDRRPLLTRGVLGALVMAALGSLLTVTQLVGALAGTSQ